MTERTCRALDRVALSAEVCRREQRRYWAARPPRPEYLLYRAKAAEGDLDRALSELAAARADERQARRLREMGFEVAGRGAAK